MVHAYSSVNNQPHCLTILKYASNRLQSLIGRHYLDTSHFTVLNLFWKPSNSRLWGRVYIANSTKCRIRYEWILSMMQPFYERYKQFIPSPLILPLTKIPRMASTAPAIDTIPNEQLQVTVIMARYKTPYKLQYWPIVDDIKSTPFCRWYFEICFFFKKKVIVFSFMFYRS